MTTMPIPIEELDSMPAAAFVDALAPLFEGAPTLLSRLASDRPFGSWWNLLARARVVAQALPEADKIELLNSHPRLGAPPETVSRASFEEQGYAREGIEWPAADLPAEGASPAGPAEPAVPPLAPPATPAPPSATAGLRGRLEAAAHAAQPVEKPIWGAASSAGAAPVYQPTQAAPAAPATPAPIVHPRVGGTDEGDSTRAKLARLNAAYEDWFGFRYCVFVAGRPLEALVPELEAALAQPRDHELQRGVDAVVDIAVARSGAAR